VLEHGRPDRTRNKDSFVPPSIPPLDEVSDLDPSPESDPVVALAIRWYQLAVRSLDTGFVALADEMVWESEPDEQTIRCFLARLDLLLTAFESRQEWIHAILSAAGNRWEEMIDRNSRTLLRVRRRFQILFRRAATTDHSGERRRDQFRALLASDREDPVRIRGPIDAILKGPAQRLARRAGATFSRRIRDFRALTESPESANTRHSQDGDASIT
jgi:hypothetical protein